MTAARTHDRDPFRALVLGLVGSGRRLRATLDEALEAGPPLAAPRPLAPGDLAVLGLLGFHTQIETLLAGMAPEAPVVAADAETAPLLRDLLR